MSVGGLYIVSGICVRWLRFVQSFDREFNCFFNSLLFFAA
jgi:hypothetical protein